MKLDPRCEKGIFVGYDKQSAAWFIFRKQLLLRVRCVKFTNSYDNSSLSKPDKNTKNPKYLITYEIELGDHPSTKGEGQIACYRIGQKDQIFL